MYHIQVTNPEAGGLTVGDMVDYLRITASTDYEHRLYPAGQLASDDLTAQASRDDIEYMGRWRISRLEAQAAAGGIRTATVDLELF
jgi:hypothetical protein